MHTSAARIGPVVSNPVTRHPGVAASALATLSMLSDGRVFLGLGTGNSALRNLGLPAARLADLREYARAVRAMIRDGVATYRGARCNLPWGPTVVGRDVPIYIAANGPRSLYLAGEVGDGVIVGSGISREVVEPSLGYIEDGARAAGRRMEDLDIWFQVDMNIAEDDRLAVEQMKNMLAVTASRSFRSTFEGKAVPRDLEQPLRLLERTYQYDRHMADNGENRHLVDELGLKDFLAERFLIAGTAETAVNRLREAERHGAKQLYLLMLAPDPYKLLEAIRDQVTPRLKS